MTLADKAKNPPDKYSSRRTCAVGRFLTTLDANEADALRTMLDRESTWSSDAIILALMDEGYPKICSEPTLHRHRHNKCSCE